MPALDTTCQKTARNYAQNAASYCCAAHTLLAGKDELAVDLVMAFYLLIGFSVELSLKSLCLSAGMTLKEVTDFRHKLPDALNAVAVRRIDPRLSFVTDVHRIIDALAPMHADPNTMRYTKADIEFLQMPPSVPCAGVALFLTELAEGLAWR